jgi:hypothetical protein
MQDNLSNTFIYGVHWDGHCLARGRLTTPMLYEMRRQSRKYKTKRQKKLEATHGPAAGGFELLMQVTGNEDLAKRYTSMVIEAWGNHVAFTRQFQNLKMPLFDAGIHIFLFGWYGPEGKIHIEPAFTHHPIMLNDEEIIDVSKAVMESVRKERKLILPKGFSIERVGAWKDREND